MPKDKNFKRLIRERMAKTGESYVTARAHLLARRPSTQPDEHDYGPLFTWGIAPVVKLAQDEARLRKNLAVRAPHVLLGLLDFGGEAVAALNAMNVSTAAVRADVERTITTGKTTTPPTIHKEASQLLALAAEESRERADATVTANALLLALASTPGPARDALARYGATEDRLRRFFADDAGPVPEEEIGARVWEFLGEALPGHDARELVRDVVISSKRDRPTVEIHAYEPDLVIGRRGQTADWIQGRLQDEFGFLFLDIMEIRPSE